MKRHILILSENVSVVWMTLSLEGDFEYVLHITHIKGNLKISISDQKIRKSFEHLDIIVIYSILSRRIDIWA